MNFKSAEEMEAYFSQMREAFSRETEQKASAETWYADAVAKWKTREISARLALAKKDIVAYVDHVVASASASADSVAKTTKTAKTGKADRYADRGKLARNLARSGYWAKVGTMVGFDDWYTADRAEEYLTRADRIISQKVAPAPALENTGLPAPSFA